jgi:hypothetical protein
MMISREIDLESVPRLRCERAFLTPSAAAATVIEHMFAAKEAKCSPSVSARFSTS